MKVKCVKDYFDLHLKRTVKKGEALSMPKERAVELSGEQNKAGMPLVEIVQGEDNSLTEKTEEKTSQRTRKKQESGK